jgi:acetate kinase
MMVAPDRVLVVNAGSHSLHLIVVDRDDRIGDRFDVAQPPTAPATRQAVARFIDWIAPPDAVGHRLVHGGDAVVKPTVAEAAVLSAVRGVADLAPLHVPPSLHLVDLLRRAMPDVPHVLCPDTAFHAGLPEVAATYPLPAEWRAAYGLRRYGFHGLSYAWATGRAAQLLGRPAGELQMVLAHLGGGSSVCAVRDGRSVDTSMGFTPLDGVPMTTRSGAVDPGMLLWLLDGRLTRDEVQDGLYRRSGLIGLSGGRSEDTRVLVPAAEAGDHDAALALAVFTHRVRREIAAAATNLDRLDALVFTGEIGWDEPSVRRDVCAGLHLLGVPAPVMGNRTDDRPISPEGAAVPVLVVETREELQIARDTRDALVSR